MFKGRTQLGLQVLQQIIEATAEDQNITVAQIAENTKKSESFIEQIVSVLKNENLIVGMRGPGGGYSMTADADGWRYKGITIFDFSIMFYPFHDHGLEFISDKFLDTGLGELLV